LTVSSQPDRAMAATTAAASALGIGEPWQLSLLSWDITEVEELLQCPFFRPQEISLWRFAQRWRIEGAGGPTNTVDMDASISDALLWELLPERESLLAAGSDTKLDCQSSEPSAMNLDSQSLEDDVGVARQQENSGFVSGNSFVHVPRFPDALLSRYDRPDLLCLHTHADSEGLRCWNCATDQEVVGATRQMIASRIPMSSAGGMFRMDLRVVSGTDSETAHLFAVGLAANPAAGVQFKVSGPGAFRPDSEGEASPFFSLVSVLDSLLEGVRMAVEIDFDQHTATVRNIPLVDGVDTAPEPTSLAAWMSIRADHQARLDRPPGEQEDPLFREHAEHLHELISEGKLNQDLVDAVLGDGGARCVRGAGAPDVPEDYYFYIVIPAGMEVEMY